MKKIEISAEDSNLVEELFIEYNAMLDIMNNLVKVNDVYSESLRLTKLAKHKLEIAKRETVGKYLDPSKVNNYQFNFINNTIEYDER